MQSIKFVIVILALLGGPCLATIIVKPQNQSEFPSHLVEAAVKIFTSCFGGQVSGVGIHGDPTGILFNGLLSKQILPAILFGDTSAVAHHESVRKESSHKLQHFAIVVSSTTQLQRAFKRIKDSPWWNHMASFVILNWIPKSDHDCSNASEFLSTAWEMNLLNVNLLCVHRANKVLLYTFNPYTKIAPYPWKLKRTFRGENDNSWSMFVKKIQEDNVICEGLNYDKTLDLGGYKIPSSVGEEAIFWHTNLGKTGVDMFEGLDGKVMQILFRAMNANVDLTTYSANETIVGWDDEKNMIGFVLNVIEGNTDIILNPVYEQRFMELTIAYPHWSGGLGVITQYSDPLSQLSKINSVLDVSSRYGLYLVMVTTIIFFKFFMRQALMTAILNTLRITCNAGLPTVPKMTSSRVYLGALFMFQVTILAIYQGQLASLLTNEVYKTNVNTMEDLIDSNHTIHGHESMASYFWDPVFKGRFVRHDTVDCEKFVTVDRSASCVEDWDLLMSREISSDLHMSTDVIIKTTFAYAIREDWPLEKRFNEILGRMTNADIFRRTYTARSEKVLGINKINEQMRTNQGPKVLTLRQLSFAFAILGIGLGCATVTFIAEIIMG